MPTLCDWLTVQLDPPHADVYVTGLTPGVKPDPAADSARPLLIVPVEVENVSVVPEIEPVPVHAGVGLISSKAGPAYPATSFIDIECAAAQPPMIVSHAPT